MIFTRHRLIYLHVPKTGGTSISRALLQHSDDEMHLHKHQDGIERFSVKGKVTPKKHAVLSTYQELLGDEFRRFDVAISVRNPLDRAVSMYFSPNRWLRNVDDEWQLEEPYWDFDRFEAMVQKMRSLADFLRIRGWLRKKVRRPDHFIHFENIGADLEALCNACGMPFDAADLPHANKSVAEIEQVEDAKSNKAVQSLIQEKFTEDFKLLKRGLNR